MGLEVRTTRDLRFFLAARTGERVVVQGSPSYKAPYVGGFVLAGAGAVSAVVGALFRADF